MLIELTDKIKVIRPNAPSRFPYSNSLYIDDREKILIDAGAGEAYHDIAVDQVNTILLSHYHFDHIHGLRFFPKARIFAGKEEEWAFTDETKYNEAGSYQCWNRLMGDVPISHDYSALPADVLMAPGFNKISLDGVFADGDIIPAGDLNIEVIHIPGHTPGHYAFFMRAPGILFSSDMDISPRGPWYGGVLSDFDEIQNSIKKLIALKPQVLVTSHRRVFYENIPELFYEYIDIALEKERQLLKYLSVPRYFEDIARQEFIYISPERTLNSVFRDRIMILKHLQSLMAKHKIKKNELNQFVYIG